MIVACSVAALIWVGDAFLLDRSLIPDLVGYCKGLVLASVGLVLRDMPPGP
jgi:hypothetical protein